MRTSMELPARAPFDFAGTAYSHGWVVLAPNTWDIERSAAGRVHHLNSGGIVLLDITAAAGKDSPGIQVAIEHHGKLGRRDLTEIATHVTRMFRLDDDLSAFYSLCWKRGGPWKKLTIGLGRLLRSPRVFEDVVKIICTTNIQWQGTKAMVAGLVQAYGQPYPADPDRKAFPVPEAIAAADPVEFASRVRMGYRAPYVHELARRVASNELDLESWPQSDLPTAELKKRLLGIKGVGDYAAATLLMLLGRYDTLAIDSVCRNFVREKYLDGRPPTDKEIHRIYEDWGEWRFLAYWFDIWSQYNGPL